MAQKKVKVPIIPGERLSSTEEAAPMLRLCPRIVQQKCAAGLIRATKPGKVWLIPESAIGEYLTERANR